MWWRGEKRGRRWRRRRRRREGGKKKRCGRGFEEGLLGGREGWLARRFCD